ncbi:putative secreted peptidase [Thermobifida fusca YX]|uniref:Putative secreted peptidase n=1 Tax=Thermobifida fusca (strain YX) TaxID=269800 RepID=Q47RX9_THEFY|nr:putative secreted peptidase [Thermobifida fusca YX]
MRYVVAKLVGAVVAGVLAASGTAVPAAADDILDWSECADLEPPDDEILLECAELSVPLDHGRGPSAGETVVLALSRVPASGQRRGVLVVNPGGPGSPGRAWAGIVAMRLPDDLRAAYDVVGFDPRGTGASRPAVVCDPAYFAPVRPDTVPADEQAEQELVDRAAAYARACAEHSGPLLHHMTTVDHATDLDALRRALGVAQIDYLGYSYGTYLGAVYATRYPERVRRLVLDSIVHPGRPWYEGNVAQSRSLDATARHFFAWAARHHDTYGLGTTGDQVADRYFALRDELARQPLAGLLGPTELETLVLYVAYTSAAWPPIAQALSAQVVHDDSTLLLDLHERLGEDAASHPEYGAYLATECTDAPWPADWGRWREDAVKTHRDAPFIAWNNVWYNAPCRFWSAPARPWFDVDGTAVDSALLLHATADGPTPVDGAYAMRARFPHGRFVIEDGGVDHGISLSGNPCIDDTLTAYLRDGTLPAAQGGADGADLTCAARPLPEPSPVQKDSEDARTVLRYAQER